MEWIRQNAIALILIAVQAITFSFVGGLAFQSVKADIANNQQKISELEAVKSNELRLEVTAQSKRLDQHDILLQKLIDSQMDQRVKIDLIAQWVQDQKAKAK